MTEQRLPQQGEVWRFNDSPRIVWCVDEQHVAVEYDNGDRGIVDLVYFLGRYTPPEPTVVTSRWLSPADEGIGIWYSQVVGCTTRLDLMSDGSFRVVEL